MITDRMAGNTSEHDDFDKDENDNDKSHDYIQDDGEYICTAENEDNDNDDKNHYNDNYRQDGGEYICTAENRVGPEAEARLLLVVSCKIIS